MKKKAVRKTGCQKAAKSVTRARATRAGPIFEITTGVEGWKDDLRKSIEQKLPNPRVRMVKSKMV